MMPPGMRPIPDPEAEMERLAGARTAEPAVIRAGWRCPGCGVHYSPDVPLCPCSGFPARRSPASPSAPLGGPACTCPPVWGGICAPPSCPAHGQAMITRVWG